MARLEPSYRNPFEQSVGEQLAQAGITPSYEELTLNYEVPARSAKYTPDFPVGRIILECKGHFGGAGRAATAKEAVKVRQKMLLVKEQHPNLDIRFIFQNPNNRLYKGSATTYAKWAEDHGFKWAAKRVPDEWLRELKEEHDRAKAETKRPSRARTPRKARLDKPA